MDSAGNLFGTTPNGGGNQSGVLFELSAGGTETIVHTFGAGPDGQNPQGEPVMDSAGNLYGAMPKGGANGDGTVFKVAN